MPGVDLLDHEDVREALRLLGAGEAPSHRAAALRMLRETMRGFGTVQSVLEHAPPAARDAFVRVATDGPAQVEDLLGRGWWGRGMLPPPLDWLQVRALVVADADGRVVATDEAREGFLALTLDVDDTLDAAEEGVSLERAKCVVVARSEKALERAAAVWQAQLRIVAPTVAISSLTYERVVTELAKAGVALDDDVAVPSQVQAPALPGTPEDAVGPRAIRSLLARAIDESRQVHLEYYASSRGGVATERTVDPWTFSDDLLTGYCHLRSGERTFAVDRIGRARLLPSEIDHTSA